MTIRIFLKCFFCAIFVAQQSYALAQIERKELNAVRVEVPPKIDGVLDDEAWQNVIPASDFIQYRYHQL